VKPRVLHFFSTRFYDELIKDRVTTRWAAVSRLPDPPALITIRSQVTQEVWRAQTDAFRSEVVAALETQHKAASEAYAMATSGEAPKTPEEYDL
jgi:predicted solute-binding protein